MLFNRYVLGFLVAIGLIVLILVLLFSGPSKPTKVPKPLTSYVSNGVVEMDIYGPIVAPQNHNELNISIDQYSATYNLLQGYDGNVISTKIYPNSANSFKAFLAALNFSGFNSGSKNSNISSLGYCSDGDVYTFKLMNNGSTVFSYWQTDCSGTPKTFEGSLNQTINLFELQIPDYGTLTSGANL